MTERVIRVELEYDGTEFAGWQVQPGLRTVQGEVERALHLLTHEETRVHAAGRTDAGVHALGQVVSFPTRSGIPGERFAPGLSRFLAADAVAKRSSEEPQGFHARYSAVGKTYRYVALLCRGRRPVTGRHVWEVWPPPDPGPMREAAEAAAGEHDFEPFAASGRMPGSTVRRLTEASVTEVGAGEDGPLGPVGGERAAVFVFRGNGFLYKMVRNLVGTLVEIGQGKRSRDAVSEALRSGDRRHVGQTAPAKGLTLVGVEYPPELDW